MTLIVPPQKLHTVISGGQCGADQGGLVAANCARVRTGGTAPKAWRTSNGPCPLLQVFGLKQDTSHEYAPRTEKNVLAADFTLLVAFDYTSPGERLTTRLCRQHDRPYHTFTLMACENDKKLFEFIDREIERATKFMMEHQIGTLNVAGNRDHRDMTTMFDITVYVVGSILQKYKDLGLLETID